MNHALKRLKERVCKSWDIDDLNNIVNKIKSGGHQNVHKGTNNKNVYKVSYRLRMVTIVMDDDFTPITVLGNNMSRFDRMIKKVRRKK